jgi:hypothetical protein
VDLAKQRTVKMLRQLRHLGPQMRLNLSFDRTAYGVRSTLR